MHSANILKWLISNHSYAMCRVVQSCDWKMAIFGAKTLKPHDWGNKKNLAQMKWWTLGKWKQWVTDLHQSIKNGCDII